MKNIYFNLLPLIKTSERNVRKFLDAVVFHKPTHQLSPSAEDLLVEYQLLAISKFVDKTEKPYYMGNQLNAVAVDTHLLVGDKNILVPYQKSVKRAKKHLGENLKRVEVFEQVGHGIECYPPSIKYITDQIAKTE